MKSRSKHKTPILKSRIQKKLLIKYREIVLPIVFSLIV